MHTNPFSLTALMSRGHSTRGSAALTTPSKFHRRAKRTACWRLDALMSPTGLLPASVRNRIGIEGCLKESIRQMSGLKDENMMLRLPAISYTILRTVSTKELSSTAYWSISCSSVSCNMGYSDRRLAHNQCQPNGKTYSSRYWNQSTREVLWTFVQV